MGLTREEVSQIAKDSVQEFLERIGRYPVAYKEPSTIAQGLQDSMIEEKTAAAWYRKRAQHATMQPERDQKTSALYEHLAADEDHHYYELVKRLREIVPPDPRIADIFEAIHGHPPTEAELENASDIQKAIKRTFEWMVELEDIYGRPLTELEREGEIIKRQLEEPTPTLKSINAAVAAEGFEERLYRAAMSDGGYYYWSDGDAAGFYKSGIYGWKLPGSKINAWVNDLKERKAEYARRHSSGTKSISEGSLAEVDADPYLTHNPPLTQESEGRTWHMHMSFRKRAEADEEARELRESGESADLQKYRVKVFPWDYGYAVYESWVE